MAYTIVKSDGTVLTTIADGTINTSSTSLGLPGRNYAGYGQSLDTNFVHQMENFADTTPPANPLRGQLWYNTNTNTLLVCPADGTSNANAWLTLAQSGGSGTTTFGSVTVTGNLQANNITANNAFTGDTITVRLATVTANASISNANVSGTATIATLNSNNITTGSAATAGNITGIWTLTGGSGTTSNAFIVTNGVINAVNGIKTDNYYYANGSPFNPTGTYTNANVSDYLTGANSVAQFTGNIAPAKVTTSNIAGGGNISGTWTLAVGARLNATYADLAERFEADATYDAGTVVELGGEAEVTAVVNELSEDVFGVISNTAAYLMNAGAGDDATHPPVAVGGRVQVKVTGKVRKGQRLVSAGNGIARAAKVGEATSFNTIGRALANKTDDNVGTVEAFVSIK
jgi:hypothetical protein